MVCAGVGTEYASLLDGKWVGEFSTWTASSLRQSNHAPQSRLLATLLCADREFRASSSDAVKRVSWPSTTSCPPPCRWTLRIRSSVFWLDTWEEPGASTCRLSKVAPLCEMRSPKASQSSERRKNKDTKSLLEQNSTLYKSTVPFKNRICKIDRLQV